MEDYPDRAIRGIYDESMVDEDGQVKIGFLEFSPRRARPDGWIEESVNWEDDDTVIGFTLAMKKETGEKKYRGGVVPIPFGDIHNLSRKQRVIGQFRYERKSIGANEFHGNLLLDKSVQPHLRDMVRNALALAAEKVIPY